MTKPEASKEDIAYENTDRELYREPADEVGMSYYQPSVHVTQDGRIGMSVDGTVIVMPIRDWHTLANPPKEKDTPIQETINENYGKCEVPVGYAVMREKQAVADYKKRLLEELDMLFKANVVLDDPHTRVLMDRQASHIKRIVEETE